MLYAVFFAVLLCGLLYMSLVVIVLHGRDVEQSHYWRGVASLNRYIEGELDGLHVPVFACRRSWWGVGCIPCVERLGNLIHIDWLGLSVDIPWFFKPETAYSIGVTDGQLHCESLQESVGLVPADSTVGSEAVSTG